MAPFARLPRLTRRALERSILGCLSVLLVAAVCTDDLYEPDDTYLEARPIRAGETQARRLCDMDWASFTVQGDSIYAVEMSIPGGAGGPGPDGPSAALLELWRRECYGSGSDYRCSVRRWLSTDGGGVNGPRFVQRYTTDQIVGQTAFAAVVPAGSTRTEALPYDLSLSCLSSCDTLGSVTVLPIAASREDLATDLLLGNPSPFGRDVELVLSRATPAGSSPPERLRARVRVPGGATIRYEDVVWTLFDVWEGDGSIEIRPLGGEIYALAVLRDPRSDVPRGEVFAPVRLAEAIDGSSSFYHLLLGTRDGASARLALHEPTGGVARARVRVRSGQGSLLAERELMLSPFEHLELDLEADLGAKPALDVFASIEVLLGHVLTASLVADRISGDVFVQRGLTASTPLGLPTRSGTYRTEVAILNVADTAPQEAALTFTAGSAPITVATRRLEPNQVWYLPDPLAEIAEGTTGTLASSAGIAAARALSREARGSVGGTAPSLRRHRSLEFRRLTMLVPPGVTSARVRGPISSLLDENGSLLSGGEDEAAFDRDESPSPSRIDVEREPYGGVQQAVYALLQSSPSPDVAIVEGEPIGRPFDRVTLTLPSPEGPVPFVVLRIPPGAFHMGSHRSEAGRDEDEELHEVAIHRPLFVGETEVSLRQWRAVMGTQPPDLPPAYSGSGAEDLPIVNVSWEEVAGPGGFLERLAARQTEGGLSWSLRLPTEAEWEYAARSRTTSPYGGLGDLARYCDLGCLPCTSSIAYCGSAARPRPTGWGPLNGFGLREVFGNVWEWVADWYGPYDLLARSDPSGPSTGQARVIRGGGWRSELRLCRAANRYAYRPSDRIDQVGFRIALSPGDR